MIRKFKKYIFFTKIFNLNYLVRSLKLLIYLIEITLSTFFFFQFFFREGFIYFVLTYLISHIPLHILNIHTYLFNFNDINTYILSHYFLSCLF